MVNNYKVNVGDIIFFIEGKDKRSISHTKNGKVILCKHKIPVGYAEVKTIEDRDRCIIVTAEHTVKDLYSQITYEDFLKVLPLFGYKIGFDRTFINNLENKDFIEHQIFAYNLENKVCIVAETFTGKIFESDKTVVRQFNKINIYLPSKSIFDFRYRNILVSQGNDQMTVLNVIDSGYKENNVLEQVQYIMCKVKERKGKITWPQNENPKMWTYMDDTTDEHGNWILNDSTIGRLKLAPKECLQIFEGCSFLDKIK